MQELLQRVEELRMENDYQLRLKDMNYNDKIKELTEKFIQEMESLKTKNQVLKTDKDKEEAKHEEKTAELMEKQSNEVRELGMSNELCFATYWSSKANISNDDTVYYALNQNI